MSTQRFNRVDRVRSARGFSDCHSRLCFSGESADCVSTLESVCGKYGSLSTELPDVQPAAKLRDDVDQELEHVSFTFDTIKLNSLIVCGLSALPHDLVPNQTQYDVCCVCIAEAANPCVAAYLEYYQLRVLSHSSSGDDHARAPCDKIALVSILFLPV